MRFPRSSGILLHPTSLPSRYGIGDLGDRAYRFIDFLAQAGQRLWQILPLGPTGYGDSPYQCFSASAGNPLLVSPDQLVADGYLDQSDLDDVPDFPVEYVDYGWVIQYKEQLLDKAFNRFEVNATDGQKSAFDSFCQERGEWLQDFALFMALKRHHMHHEGGVWNKWPSDIAFREPGAIEDWTEKLGREVESVKFAQFLFYTQWFALKRYANERDIKIVGDVPIFVAYDSADVWANRDLFFLDEAGDPTFVAGVPPDYFSETGQRWGNPLYRWKTLAARGYDWWVNRLRSNFELVDILRIDHFRGFQAYWAIPFSEPTAVVGKWAKGPGASFFRAMRDELGELPIIAEDLGVITSDVVALREKFDFPGMKILQFAFGGECNNSFLPHSFEPNSVVYTGTHDNETTRGWYESASPGEQDHVRRYVSSDGSDIAWDMIRIAFSSVSDMAVVPLQDVMNLGNEARMNFPSKASGNWQWRYADSMLTDAAALGLNQLANLYGRCAESVTYKESE